MTPWFLPLLTAPPHPKVLDQDTDAIAVHVVRVLTCIMSGSPSAKVRTTAVGVWSGSEIDHVAPELALLVAVRASETVTRGGDHPALWGAAQAIGWAWSSVSPGRWVSRLRAGWGKDNCGLSIVCSLLR